VGTEHIDAVAPGGRNARPESNGVLAAEDYKLLLRCAEVAMHGEWGGERERRKRKDDSLIQGRRKIRLASL